MKEERKLEKVRELEEVEQPVKEEGDSFLVDLDKKGEE